MIDKGISIIRFDGVRIPRKGGPVKRDALYFGGGTGEGGHDEAKRTGPARVFVGAGQRACHEDGTDSWKNN